MEVVSPMLEKLFPEIMAETFPCCQHLVCIYQPVPLDSALKLVGGRHGIYQEHSTQTVCSHQAVLISKHYAADRETDIALKYTGAAETEGAGRAFLRKCRQPSRWEGASSPRRILGLLRPAHQPKNSVCCSLCYCRLAEQRNEPWFAICFAKLCCQFL